MEARGRRDVREHKWGLGQEGGWTQSVLVFRSCKYLIAPVPNFWHMSLSACQKLGTSSQNWCLLAKTVKTVLKKLKLKQTPLLLYK